MRSDCDVLRVESMSKHDFDFFQVLPCPKHSKAASLANLEALPTPRTSLATKVPWTLEFARVDFRVQDLGLLTQEHVIRQLEGAQTGVLHKAKARRPCTDDTGPL